MVDGRTNREVKGEIFRRFDGYMSIVCVDEKVVFKDRD